MADKKDKKPCCEEKVKILVQSKGFTDKDHDWLSGLEESQIDSLIAVNVRAEKVPKEKVVEKEVPVQMNKEQLAAYMKETFSSPEQFMAILPDDYKAQMTHGMQLYQQHRDRLVARVKEAAPDVYTDAELTGMDMSSLEKLTRLIPARADYSLNGNPPAPVVNNEVKPLLPPGVKEAE